MEFREIQQFEGECCPSQMITGQISQDLHCIICYEVITRPVVIACPSSHTFGMACLKSWIQKKDIIKCPYCRGIALSWTPNEKLQNQVLKLSGKCIFCKEWEGSLSKIEHHKRNCSSYLLSLQKDLEETVCAQIKQLDIQINPHLKQSHAEIYEKYVDNWQWLHSDSRDWKWWWWCQNEWWQNKSCAQCNILWHKYERNIDVLEQRRVDILRITLGGHKDNHKQEQN